MDGPDWTDRLIAVVRRVVRAGADLFAKPPNRTVVRASLRVMPTGQTAAEEPGD